MTLPFMFHDDDCFTADDTAGHGTLSNVQAKPALGEMVGTEDGVEGEADGDETHCNVQEKPALDEMVGTEDGVEEEEDEADGDGQAAVCSYICIDFIWWLLVIFFLRYLVNIWMLSYYLVIVQLVIDGVFGY